MSAKQHINNQVLSRGMVEYKLSKRRGITRSEDALLLPVTEELAFRPGTDTSSYCMIRCNNNKAKLSNGIMHTCAANSNMHYTMAALQGPEKLLCCICAPICVRVRL
jgi:hypothetical protein